uniref:UBN2 domain-containing protein n=1 Tax=Glycine max TaxID=3847 RepID=A0A368UMJ9_SOYBN
MRCSIIKKDEIIDEMFGSFQTILNDVQALGHEFTKAQNNLNILQSLPKMWEPKSATIQEAYNMKCLPWTN